MARFYHVDIAVFAAESDRKWVDNLLSHFDVPGVESAKQGVARRVSADGVYHIVLIRRLSLAVGLSLERAVALAQRLLRADASPVSLGHALELRIDRQAFHREVDDRIALAVEAVVPRRRGRPPASG